jgi:hypothetical protein
MEEDDSQPLNIDLEQEKINNMKPIKREIKGNTHLYSVITAQYGSFDLKSLAETTEGNYRQSNNSSCFTAQETQ